MQFSFEYTVAPLNLCLLITKDTGNNLNNSKKKFPVLVKYHQLHLHSFDRLWMSVRMQVCLSHSCPPPGSSFFLVGDSFLLLNQLYNRSMQFMLIFLYLEETLWRSLSDFHLRHVPLISTVVKSFCFFYHLGYLLQFVFVTSLLTSPLSSCYAKQMSLYREIGACQYADCRYRARACQFRMILIHEHTHSGKNKVSPYARVMNPTVILRMHLFGAQRKNISTHILVNEAQCLIG